jgi:hypothetical protein
MTYEIANMGSSSLRFEKVGVEFQTSTVGKQSEFFTSANTMMVVTPEGYMTYYGGPFGTEPDLPEDTPSPFVIPPSGSVELEASGTGTPLQLITDGAEARRDYRVIVTLYTGSTAVHGPFTIHVTAREGRDRGVFAFE